MRKLFIYLGLVILILILVTHTLVISLGYTFGLYERLRDFLIIIICLVFLKLNFKNYLLEKKNSWIYLLLANLFLIILLIHMLKLIHGGLLC
jgi:hypothetical protein